ncbi:MAG: decarboxylase [Bradymonadaceae bacterium]|nr:decarboxylase [Lujinxingiaceae bacterium]
MKDEQTPACDPRDIALKSFFLGPQSENASWFEALIGRVFRHWFGWRRSIYPQDGCAISVADQTTPEFEARRARFGAELDVLLARFEDEVPKFSPRYFAHMFSELSLPAMVGHIVTLLHNPNNVSGESSRVGIRLEEEAVGFLAAMVGFGSGIGHFTSGGTLANFEALYRARIRMDRWLSLGTLLAAGGEELDIFGAAHMGWQRFDREMAERGLLAGDLRATSMLDANPFALAAHYHQTFGHAYLGPVVLVPQNKHYSWPKGVRMMGLGEEAFWPVALCENGRLSTAHLQERIAQAQREQRPILMVVSVAGTTELGDFDPIDEVQDILDACAQTHGHHIWHHVDAAYGGFFCSALGDAPESGPAAFEPHAHRALSAIGRANSVTLDPHKLGYVPYACGTYLSRESREYFLLTIDAPYLELTEGRDRGPQTIEGSRSASGAVATWLTARTIGLDAAGYGRILARTVQCRRQFQALLLAHVPDIHIAPGASSNIVCFCIARPGEPLSQTNARTLAIYEAYSPEHASEFFVSKTSLRFATHDAYLASFTATWHATPDQDELRLIRLCVMNPFLDSRETNLRFAEAFVEDLVRRI